MLGLFKKSPVIDEQSRQWLFETFAWSLQNFNAQVFFTETILVTPSNEHFPGRENSIHGMADLIFTQVKEYAGLNHWPCRLVDDNTIVSQAPEPLQLDGAQRGKSLVGATMPSGAHIIVPYNANQIGKPEALIASYAHILAHYLGTFAKTPPPGGSEYWPYSTEVLAVFLGFGLMMANSAYTYRGGCGSCYNPLAERSAFLSQDELSYALAIFCSAKNIPSNQASGHLKSYLRPVFKKAMKEIKDSEELTSLRRYSDIQV